MPCIELKNVTYLVNDRKKKIAKAILYKVNTEFESNCINVILGYSGSGKSTLLKAIAGLIQIDNGSILFNKIDMTNAQPSKRNLSLMSQEFALYPHLTVFENIAYPLTINKLPIEDIKTRVKEMATFMGIELLLNRKPKQLSIGQQQRVALSRALVKKPDILLLDEPFSNIDPLLKESLIFDIKKIQKEFALTVILVTHNVKDALRLADNIYIVTNGTVNEYGPKDELLDNKTSFFNRNFKDVEELKL